jgi:hypothetical protein
MEIRNASGLFTPCFTVFVVINQYEYTRETNKHVHELFKPRDITKENRDEIKFEEAYESPIESTDNYEKVRKHF